MLKDLVTKSRSVRRFYQDHQVEMDTLRELVELARLSPSGGNQQPLRFILSADPAKNALIFPHLVWALALRDWHGPEEEERPAAYIIILCDTRISKSPNQDPGIAAQTMLLGAAEKGLAGCMFSSIKKEGLRADLKIPEHYSIELALALGKGKETVVIEPVGPDGNTKYHRDSEGIHYVPKRALEDLIIE